MHKLRQVVWGKEELPTEWRNYTHTHTHTQEEQQNGMRKLKRNKPDLPQQQDLYIDYRTDDKTEYTRTTIRRSSGVQRKQKHNRPNLHTADTCTHIIAEKYEEYGKELLHVLSYIIKRRPIC